MIQTIIFDFGDVFINLKKEKLEKKLRKIGLTEWNDDLKKLNEDYETGKIRESEFFLGIQKYAPETELYLIRRAWNSIIGDFPVNRLEFLERIATNYKLFLLSNTDATHIDVVERKLEKEFYNRFTSCFEKVYFSFEIGMKKPDEAIFKFVIKENNLNPSTTLFVDDNLENIKSAKNAGLLTWHLQVGKEDVTDLEDYINKNYDRFITNNCLL